MNRPHADSGDICPFHQKDVAKVCHKCPLYIQIRGRNPQTGQEVDQWGCSFAWLPMLTIENSQQQHQTGAAIESFRNEVVKENQAMTNAMMIAASSKRAKAENEILIEDYSDGSGNRS